MNKKGQTGGLITSLVFGIASLVIGVIIAFVIVSTLTGANLITESNTLGLTVTNESGYVNQTTYTLSGYNSTWSVMTITGIWDYTTGTVIPAANYTFALGVLQNETIKEVDTVNLSYTYTHSWDTDEFASIEKLEGNFSEGIDNVSDKIPTVLLVAAIVLILGVLAILVGVWQRMRMGGGTQL